MKQIHLSWLLMAAAVITACEKERIETEPAVEKTPYVYSVKATISSDGETRTDYDASGKFSWTAGDAISVLFNDGSTNKFFTLTTEEGGETATFSGTIDAGYEIGALDGADGDLKIWALYPASDSHSYADGSTSFYVQPQVDFSETGFSANIPMYDLLSEEGAFSFKNLASTYRFNVKNLDPGVEKVKFTVYNQQTYGLSGSWPIGESESDRFIDYGYASPGSEESTLTFISPVTDGQAVFYVPTRYWGKFQPVITISDADHDLVLKTFTAGAAKQPSSFTDVPQISLSVPTGLPIAIVDGVIEEWKDVPAIAGNNTRILEWKYVSDEENVYFLFKVDKAKISFGSSGYNWGSYIFTGFDTDNDSTTGANAGGGVTGGFEAMCSVYPWRGNVEGSPECYKGEEPNGTIACPVGTELGHVTVAGSFDGDYCYIETRVPLALIGSPNGDITVKHGMNYYLTGETVITVGAAASEPREATIHAEDVAVSVGKTVAIGATTNSSAAIEYVSGDTGIATVSEDGTVTGVAAGSTTITLSVPAVEGKYTAASKTINVTVSEAPASAINVDGDISDWADIGAVYSNSGNSRIREIRFKSDAENVYFLLMMRKNRAYDTPRLCIGFDTDNDSTSGSSTGNIPGCEVRIECIPFTNAGSGTQPVCVNGPVPDPTINGTTVANSLIAWMYDEGAGLSDSSNIYLEMSIPRSKMDLPASGSQITIGCSYDWYVTDTVGVVLE